MVIENRKNGVETTFRDNLFGSQLVVWHDLEDPENGLTISHLKFCFRGTRATHFKRLVKPLRELRAKLV